MGPENGSPEILETRENKGLPSRENGLDPIAPAESEDERRPRFGVGERVVVYKGENGEKHYGQISKVTIKPDWIEYRVLYVKDGQVSHGGEKLTEEELIALNGEK